MVKIIYKVNGEKNKKCNFIYIQKEERIKFVKLIKKVKVFDKDIEVNIVKFGQLKYEVNNDHLILAKLSNDILSIYGLGKRFLPEELYLPYKNEKICYCCHGNDFENTILTAFHASAYAKTQSSRPVIDSNEYSFCLLIGSATYP